MSFPTREVAQLFPDIGWANIRYYANRGLLVPSVRPGLGRGTVALYSFADLVAGRLILALRDAVGLSVVSPFVSYIQGRLDEDLHEPHLYLWRSVEFLGDEPVLGPVREGSCLPQPTQFTLVVNLSRLVEDVRTRLEGVKQ